MLLNFSSKTDPYTQGERTCAGCGEWFDDDELWLGHCEGCIQKADAKIEEGQLGDEGWVRDESNQQKPER